MDIVVVIFVLGAIAVMIFKKFKSVIYYIVLSDILFRILAFISANIQIKFITNFFETYFPNSLSSIISNYSSGIFTTVLKWFLVVVYIIFEFYIIKIFLKKK